VQWRVLRFIEDSVQVGFGNGRQVTFRCAKTASR
jgi:hypothetical protein